MADFETILTHQDQNLLRVIVVALRAHGFHPQGEELAGALGIPGLVPPKGVGIIVPSAEAEDARLLANALLEEMKS